MPPALAPGDAASKAAIARPEVLAPAGDFECARAAVENGADAVYFGLSKHNARARATNFTIEALPELLAYLRLHGVRAYVAFNTLIFADELPDAARYLEKIIACGPGALIVQDLGVARLAREISPGVRLHASTQTTTTSAEQMKHLRELGFERVILARELTIDDVRKIRAATDMPLEVFVHGALCVAYSGQCLTSEALGGRSANRGACAQACRLPYDLVVDGVVKDLGVRKYLISPQDLETLQLVPELCDLGIAALKIEGRLKTPEYVAATSRAYRRAVDGVADRSRQESLDLQQVFSRGFSRGWLGGINHQTLVQGLSPKKRGVLLGVVSNAGVRIRLKLEAPVKPGDGIVLDDGHPEEDEAGGRVYEVRRDGRRVESADAPDVVELSVDFRGKVGQRVWKTDDPEMRRRLRASFETPHRRVPIDATVEGKPGAPLRLTLGDGVRRVSLESAQPLTEARSRPFTPEYLREHLGRLSDTPFELRNLEARVEGFLPVSLLNDLRRRLAANLESERKAAPHDHVRTGALERLRTPVAPAAPREPELVVLCRSLEQLDAVLAEGIRRVECDFDNPKLYRDAVAKARAAGAWIALAPPRVFKPGEGAIVRRAVECAPDALLVRSLAHLEFAAGLEKIGDFSLNVANDLTARWLLSKGCARLVPSYDLSLDQLAAVLREVPAGRFEVVVHQHMPMFHMEHCVIAMALSDGTDATNCGRPCDRHALDLRDRTGRSHPLTADIGCRNTIFNAVPQSASPYIARLLDLGVRFFRVELLRQSADASRRLVRAYGDILEGRADGGALWRELRASNFFGVTRGPLGD